MYLAIAVSVSDPLGPEIVRQKEKTAWPNITVAKLDGLHGHATWSSGYLLRNTIRQCRPAKFRLRQQDISVWPPARASSDASVCRPAGFGRRTRRTVFGKHRDERPPVSVVYAGQKNIWSRVSLDSPQRPHVSRISEHQLCNSRRRQAYDKRWPPDSLDDGGPDRRSAVLGRDQNVLEFPTDRSYPVCRTQLWSSARTAKASCLWTRSRKVVPTSTDARARWSLPLVSPGSPSPSTSTI